MGVIPVLSSLQSEEQLKGQNTVPEIKGIGLHAKETILRVTRINYGSQLAEENFHPQFFKENRTQGF